MRTSALSTGTVVHALRNCSLKLENETSNRHALRTLSNEGRATTLASRYPLQAAA
jgi:hypothetical protein